MTQSSTPPRTYFNSSILQKIKEGYLLWLNIVNHIPKDHRYTIGVRIENKFLDLLENSYLAYFIAREKKTEKITHCILILDTLKFIISITWEAKLISPNQYEETAIKLEEIGKMFGGWKNSLDIPLKKNRDL